VTGADAFTAAFYSLRVAATNEADWWLFVDADVRLYENTAEVIADAASAATPDVYQIRFALDDKITNAPLYGVHLHRGCFVQNAYSWFRSQGTPGLRGESRNIKAFMAAAGLRTSTSDWIVGSHDYGQFFRDLAIKYFIRGFRYRKNVAPLRRCLVGREYDTDVLVALNAIDASANAQPPVSDARTAWSPDSMLTALGIREKQPLSRTHEPDDIYQLCHHVPSSTTYPLS